MAKCMVPHVYHRKVWTGTECSEWTTSEWQTHQDWNSLTLPLIQRTLQKSRTTCIRTNTGLFLPCPCIFIWTDTVHVTILDPGYITRCYPSGPQAYSRHKVQEASHIKSLEHLQKYHNEDAYLRQTVVGGETWHHHSVSVHRTRSTYTMQTPHCTSSEELLSNKHLPEKWYSFCWQWHTPASGL
jgi:hypothetical protein